MMINLRLVSHNIRSCRLRAFALPGLRANAANSFLGCLSHMVCESSAWLIRLAEDMLIHRFAASTHCLHFGSDLNIGDHHSKRATISSTQHCLHLILRLRPLSSSYLCCSNTRKQ
uniref:Uncharacterized protein n=1 Tax=Oryza glumipatula TaxID=40148 RepID=A0A0D9ZNS5_9ORYZ